MKLENPEQLKERIQELENENARLKETEEKFKAFYENAPLPYQSLDQDGYFIDVNPNWLKTLGYKRTEVIGEYFGSFLHADWNTRFEENFPELKRRGYIHNVEFRMKHKNGHYIDVLYEGNAEYEPDGRFQQIYCSFKDITQQKKAEINLQKKNEELEKQKAELTQYKRMVEGSDDIMAAVDSDYKYLRVNSAFLKYHQLIEEEVLGKTAGEILGEQFFKEKIQPYLEKCFNGKNVKQEFIGQSPEFGKVHLDINYYPLKKDQGIDGAVAVMRDVTERKKSEENLLKNKTILEEAEKLSNIGSYEWDIPKNELTLSEGWQKIHGINKNKLNIDMLMPIAHPDDRMRIEKAHEDALNNITPYDLEHRIIRQSDNETRHIRARGRVFFDENGKPSKMYGSVEDVTERKKAEQSLKESEEKHRFLFENMTQGVVYHKSNGEIFYANPSAAQILGLTFDQLYGKTSFDPRWKTIHEDGSDFRRENHPAMISLKTGKAVYNKKMGVFNPQKNDYSWININSIPKFKENQTKPYQAVVTFEDITEREQTKKDLRRAKEKAEESDRLKSAFLANMSHEIRTPMNGIMGFSQMLQEKEFSKEKRDKYLDIIHSRTSHLLNIINDLVDVSRIEANQLTLNFQQFCLNDVLNELYRVYNNELKVKEKTHVQLNLNKSLDSRNSYIYSDPSRFRQIMGNLLNNAIKFTHEGSIEFGYELTPEGRLLFYVKDTGIGIPGNEQENIFERFRQSEGTTSRRYDGTGLGLTISRNLVELMGGKMWIDSTEGEGSVFYFTLPYETQQATGKEEVKEEVIDETEGEGKTLLVIEDDPTSLQYMKALLEPSGFNIVACTTGKEGYETFLNHLEIDLILMDIKLPDTTGLELTRKIRSSAGKSDVPIIAQTAYAMSEDARKSLDAGCDDYISKPIDKKKLLTKMYKFL